MKLNTIKSSDKKTNLLYYLCLMTSEGCPLILTLPETFRVLKELAQVKMMEIVQKLKWMDKELEFIQGYHPLPLPPEVTHGYTVEAATVMNKINEFIDDALPKLQDLKTLQETLHTSWQQTADYFGEDLQGDIKEPEDLFVILHEFFMMMDKANKENEHYKVMEEKKKQKKHKQQQQQHSTKSVGVAEVLVKKVQQQQDDIEDGNIDSKFISVRNAVRGSDEDEEDEW